MFCNRCGQSLPDNSSFCSKCGAGLAPTIESSATPDVAPPSIQPATDAQANSGKAVASLVTGIIGLLCVFPSAVAAIILGHISRSEIRRSQGRLKGDGMALTGLVLGYAAVAMLPLIMIIAAIAIPNLLRARIAANEASAVGALRTIATAQVTYAEAYPQAGFACELQNLAGNAHTADGAGLIDNSLGSGTKNGYRFEVHCDSPANPVASYRAIAIPVTAGQTGTRAFCTDESGIIRYVSRASEECNTQSSPLQ